MDILTLQGRQLFVGCFYGISTLVGYLMLNPVFTRFVNKWFLGNFILKQVVRAHLFAQLNGYKYSYATPIILFIKYSYVI